MYICFTHVILAGLHPSCIRTIDFVTPLVVIHLSKHHHHHHYEGVNLPWLSWICFRRETRSRVRFQQEFGRVLRVSPNKKIAYILDPLGLCFRFKLSQDAVLQGIYHFNVLLLMPI
jgi:hypothetical protein